MANFTNKKIKTLIAIAKHRTITRGKMNSRDRIEAQNLQMTEIETHDINSSPFFKTKWILSNKSLFNYLFVYTPVCTYSRIIRFDILVDRLINDYWIDFIDIQCIVLKIKLLYFMRDNKRNFKNEDMLLIKLTGDDNFISVEKYDGRKDLVPWNDSAIQGITAYQEVIEQSYNLVKSKKICNNLIKPMNTILLLEVGLCVASLILMFFSLYLCFR